MTFNEKNFEHDFFLSHAGSDGRMIALEIQGQLAFLGLNSYIANLENRKIKDDEFLLQKMEKCKSLIVIFTQGYCERLSKDILSTTNYVCFEIDKAFGFDLDISCEKVTGSTEKKDAGLRGIYTRDEEKDRHIFIIGFGDWTAHSLRRNFINSNSVRTAFDAKRDEKVDEKQNFINKLSKIVAFEPTLSDKPYSESVHDVLVRLSHNKELSKYFQRDFDPNNEITPNRAVIFTSSLPCVQKEIDKTFKELKELTQKCRSKEDFIKYVNDNLDDVKEKLIPHKFDYANDLGAAAYIALFEENKTDQGQTELDEFLERFKETTTTYIADMRILGHQIATTQYDEDNWFFNNSDFDVLRNILFDAINISFTGTLNIVSLGVGIGTREASIIETTLSLLTKINESNENQAFKQGILGSIHYYLTDISLPLICKAIENTKKCFKKTTDELKKLLMSIDILPIFCSFGDIDKLKAELKRKPNTRNLFFLLGNTYSAITDNERENFGKNIKEITNPGDVLMVEIDSKLSHSAMEKAKIGKFGNKLKPFFTSFFSLLPQYNPVDENGNIVVERFLTNDKKHEVIYTRYYSLSNQKENGFLPLTIVPVGHICEYSDKHQQCNKQVDNIKFVKEVFKEHTNILFKQNIWHLDGVIRLYKKDQDVTLIIGILRRIPEKLPERSARAL